MNVVLKTGTSAHHGTIYEFMRRTSLDANTFQNNAGRRQMLSLQLSPGTLLW